MRSYSETEPLFTASMLSAFALTQKVVVYLPDRTGKRLTRCHEVARVVEARLLIEAFHGLQVRVYDGHYGPIEHSWLVLTAEERSAILDPYAVGQLPQVQLLTPTLGHAALYEVGPARSDVRKGDIKLMMEQVSRMEATAATFARI